MTKYDYLIVGGGLFGATFAYLAKRQGKKCLVVDKRSQLGGNLYCENVEGINVHKYGAHIFHTSNKHVWDFVNSLVEFNHFVNAPIANYKGKLYNLPFNMNTFYQMWGVHTPKEAQIKLEEQRTEVLKIMKSEGVNEPRNLEEQALTLIGRDIYERLIKGYTEKQWGRKCTELPAFIIKRLPVRYTYDNNYFNDRFQGIPMGGYTKMIERMLEGIEVRLGVDFLKHRDEYETLADKIIYTGPIDEYFGYSEGVLEYRGLHFETDRLEEENHQGVAVLNYTEGEIPYTRIIEHKHFEFGTQPVTYVTKEYPKDWEIGEEAYYPVNDVKNLDLYAKYVKKAETISNVIFGGRLGEYKYYDMDKVIASALTLVEKELA